MKLVVTIQDTELREKDEIDKTAFTMYQLEVVRSGVDNEDSDSNTWTLFRRYSQFHELMTVLGKNHKASHEVNKNFPPKQAFGNLVEAFVSKRKEALQAWVTALLGIPEMLEASEVLGFFEAKEGLVTLGSESPPLRLTDVHGRVCDSAKLDGKTIVVYSAASRYNFSKLTQWLEPCIEALLVKWPCLKIQFVSVADLREVPEKMVGMVKPILLSVDKKNRNKQLTFFANNKATVNKFSRSQAYFIPDFTGDTLKTLGFEDANWTFRLSIVMDGRVQGTVQSSTKNIAATFTKALEECVEKFPSLVVEDVEAKLAEDAETKMKEEALGAGKVHEEILEVSNDHSILTWKYETKDGTVEFGLSYVAEEGGDEEQLLIPFLPVTAKTGNPICGSWDVRDSPGKYIVRFGNKGSTFFGIKVGYQVAVM